MDGFHLANVALTSLGLAERKGALETFDAAGFAALLARIRAEGPDTVWAPTYDRSVEESIAGAIPVPPGTEVVVSEGNYLLVDEGPWAQVGELLDEVWAVRVDAAIRTERLIARHVRYGRTPAEAAAWVASVDEPNAAVIRATLGRADLDVSTGGGNGTRHTMRACRRRGSRRSWPAVPAPSATTSTTSRVASGWW